MVTKSLMAPVPGTASRRAALHVLHQVRAGRPFEAALDHAVKKLSLADRRLAHELAAGVLRWRTHLDQQLAPLVHRGWAGVAPELQDILRLGAYQLTALERIPAHAAVDTSVALAKISAGASGAAFVNAVLRRLARSAPLTAGKSDDVVIRLATEYSHPAWLVSRWINRFGIEQTQDLLRWNNTRPRVVIQPARRDQESLASRWRTEGIVFDLAAHDAGLVPHGSPPALLPGYAEGDFIVQDPAQALLIRFAAPPAHSLVYDACAAPGGKTIALGRLTGRVVAGEISRRRAARLAENLSRAGSGREHVMVADARHPPLRAADLVLLDVPCLGTGTFARHPDARWRVTPEALSRIAELQSELLIGAADLVPAGGLLVYSTCSLEPEENHLQIERFLANHPAFHREKTKTVPDSLTSPEGDLVILPQLHGIDGAYAARLRREA
jgi:16S rRNA (cytosine967-C5)-methyltransferase